MFEFERKKNQFGLDCEDYGTIFDKKNKFEFDLPSPQSVIPEFKHGRSTMLEFEPKLNQFRLDREDDCTIFDRKNKFNFDLPSLQPVVPELKPAIEHYPMFEPIRTFDREIGFRDPFSGNIQPHFGGPPLQVTGQFVHDVMGNCVGHLQGNIMLPPPSW